MVVIESCGGGSLADDDIDAEAVTTNDADVSKRLRQPRAAWVLSFWVELVDTLWRLLAALFAVVAETWKSASFISQIAEARSLTSGEAGCECSAASGLVAMWTTLGKKHDRWELAVLTVEDGLQKWRVELSGKPPSCSFDAAGGLLLVRTAPRKLEVIDAQSGERLRVAETADAVLHMGIIGSHWWYVTCGQLKCVAFEKEQGKLRTVAARECGPICCAAGDCGSVVIAGVYGDLEVCSLKDGAWHCLRRISNGSSVVTPSTFMAKFEASFDAAPTPIGAELALEMADEVCSGDLGTLAFVIARVFAAVCSWDDFAGAVSAASETWLQTPRAVTINSEQKIALLWGQRVQVLEDDDATWLEVENSRGCRGVAWWCPGDTLLAVVPRSGGLRLLSEDGSEDLPCAPSGEAATSMVRGCLGLASDGTLLVALGADGRHFTAARAVEKAADGQEAELGELPARKAAWERTARARIVDVRASDGTGTLRWAFEAATIAEVDDPAEAKKIQEAARNAARLLLQQGEAPDAQLEARLQTASDKMDLYDRLTAKLIQGAVEEEEEDDCRGKLSSSYAASAVSVAALSRRPTEAPTWADVRDDKPIAQILARSGECAALGELCEIVDLQLLECIPETVPPASYAAWLPTGEASVEWYKRRAIEMDRRAGCIRNAEALLSIGLGKVGIEGALLLKAPHRNAWHLVRLAYSEDGGFAASWSLEEWQSTSRRKKLETVLLRLFEEEQEGCAALVRPLVEGKFALPPDDDDDDDDEGYGDAALLLALRRLVVHEDDEEQSVARALMVCRACSSSKLLKSRGALASLLVDVVRIHSDEDSLRLLLEALPDIEDDEEDSVQSLTAMAFLDDLRSRLDVVETLRGVVELPMSCVRSTSPRCDESAIATALDSCNIPELEAVHDCVRQACSSDSPTMMTRLVVALICFSEDGEERVGRLSELGLWPAREASLMSSIATVARVAHAGLAVLREEDVDHGGVLVSTGGAVVARAVVAAAEVLLKSAPSFQMDSARHRLLTRSADDILAARLASERSDVNARRELTRARREVRGVVLASRLDAAAPPRVILKRLRAVDAQDDDEQRAAQAAIVALQNGLLLGEEEDDERPAMEEDELEDSYLSQALDDENNDDADDAQVFGAPPDHRTTAPIVRCARLAANTTSGSAALAAGAAARFEVLKAACDGRHCASSLAHDLTLTLLHGAQKLIKACEEHQDEESRRCRDLLVEIALKAAHLCLCANVLESTAHKRTVAALALALPSGAWTTGEDTFFLECWSSSSSTNLDSTDVMLQLGGEALRRSVSTTQEEEEEERWWAEEEAVGYALTALTVRGSTAAVAKLFDDAGSTLPAADVQEEAPFVEPLPLLVSELVAQGFPKPSAERAAVATRNAGLASALRWCVEHSDDDADFAEKPRDVKKHDGGGSRRRRLRRLERAVWDAALSAPDNNVLDRELCASRLEQTQACSVLTEEAQRLRNVDADRYSSDEKYRAEALLKAATSDSGLVTAIDAARRGTAADDPRCTPAALATLYLERLFEDVPDPEALVRRLTSSAGAATRSAAGAAGVVSEATSSEEEQSASLAAINTLREHGKLLETLKAMYANTSTGDPRAIYVLCRVIAKQCPNVDKAFALRAVDQASALRPVLGAVAKLTSAPTFDAKRLLGDLLNPNNAAASSLEELRLITRRETVAVLARHAKKFIGVTSAEVYAVAFRAEMEHFLLHKNEVDWASLTKKMDDELIIAELARVIELLGGGNISRLAEQLVQCQVPHADRFASAVALGSSMRANALAALLNRDHHLDLAAVLVLAHREDTTLHDLRECAGHLRIARGEDEQDLVGSALRALAVELCTRVRQEAASRAASDAFIAQLQTLLFDRLLAEEEEEEQRRTCVIETLQKEMAQPTTADDVDAAERIRCRGLVAELCGYGDRAAVDPLLFRVSELVARGWGGSLAAEVLASDEFQGKDLFRRLLSEDLSKNNRGDLLWELLSLLSGASLTSSSSSSSRAALAARRTLRGEDLEATEFGGCWLELLSALPEASSLEVMQRHGAPEGCVPDAAAEAAWVAGLPIKAGLLATQASTRLAAAKRLTTDFDLALQSGALLPLPREQLHAAAVEFSAAAPPPNQPTDFLDSPLYLAAAIVLCAAKKHSHADMLLAANCLARWLRLPTALCNVDGAFATLEEALKSDWCLVSPSTDRGWETWPELRQAAQRKLTAYLR